MRATPTAKVPGADDERKARNNFRMANDEVNRAYNRASWHKTSALCRSLNPICQKIVKDPITGTKAQCRNPSTLAHHKHSPRRGGPMLDLKNLIALCSSCHTDEEGTPHWTESIDYVPSNYPHYLKGEL
jgi:hypothetical protein